MTVAAQLHLFEGFGIELEYMIVDRDTLAAKPIANKVLERLAGRPCREFFRGPIAWSNELVLHVIELKANGPAADLAALRSHFKAALAEMAEILSEFSAMLLPTAMHPLFNPDRETKIWQDEDADIYAAYDRIFDCRGHGWSNLQSIHINFPFAGDEEFGRLHGAIRAVLPLLPAIAQSSPIVEGVRGPYLDSRLSFYMQNQRRLPTIIGPVIPEPVYTRAEYQAQILEPMYREIAPLDKDEELQDEWLNSRAAIARFSRNAIEIRLLDIGECLRSDFAVIAMVVTIVREIANERWCSLWQTQALPSLQLKEILLQVLESGGDGVIVDKQFLAVFGLDKPASAIEIWRQSVATIGKQGGLLADFSDSIEFLLANGAPAQRIMNALPAMPSKDEIVAVYRKLAGCLRDDQFFHG